MKKLPVSSLLGKHCQRSLANAGMLSMLRQLALAVVNFTSVIILSRLLPPEVFGIVALATFFTVFINAVIQTGILEALIQSPHISLDQLNKAFWINASFGAISAGLLLSISPFAVSFYGEPELQRVFYFLAFSTFFTILSQPYQTLLERNILVERIAVVTIGPALVALLVTSVLAYQGFGIDSLLWAFASTAISRWFFIFLNIDWLPGRFARDTDVSSMLRYGARNGIGSFVAVLSRNIQTLALGKYAAPAQVAFFNRGQSLFQQPVRQFSTPLVNVVFPAMCAACGDRERVQLLIMRAKWMVGLGLLPLAALFIAFGDTILPLLLGHQWEESGKVVRYLALAEVTGLLMISLSKGNSAIGRPARGLWITICSLPIVVGGVFYLAPQGAVSVAAFLSAVRWIFACAFVCLALKGSGFNHLLYLRGLIRLIFLFVLITLLSLQFRPLVPESPLSQFLFFGGIGLTIYGVFFALYHIFDEGRSVLFWLDANFLSRLEAFVGKRVTVLLPLVFVLRVVFRGYSPKQYNSK